MVKPNEVMPGIANYYYASTYFDGYDYASVIVLKPREGRPIHIEGNITFESYTDPWRSKCSRVNSSVLSPYDNTKRYCKVQRLDGVEASDWAAVDGAVSSLLAAERVKAKGGKVRILILNYD